jgi:hypothetical protein
MIGQYEGLFKCNPNFAYVCWNILQKREVSKSMRFKVDLWYLATTLSDLERYQSLLPPMLEKWKANPNMSTSDESECKMLALLNRLKVVVKDLKGSARAQLKKRNKVRAPQKEFGCQALFFMMTPADLYNILMHVLSGQNPNTFAAMTALEKDQWLCVLCSLCGI